MNSRLEDLKKEIASIEKDLKDMTSKHKDMLELLNVTTENYIYCSVLMSCKDIIEALLDEGYKGKHLIKLQIKKSDIESVLRNPIQKYIPDDEDHI